MFSLYVGGFVQGLMGLINIGMYFGTVYSVQRLRVN
jgi:hypothetical protein